MIAMQTVQVQGLWYTDILLIIIALLLAWIFIAITIGRRKP